MARPLRQLRAAVAFPVALLVLCSTASAAVPPPNFEDTHVATVPVPTSLAFTPGGRLLIATQNGHVRLHENGALDPQLALDLAPDICTIGEHGLHAIAVDPAFATNHFVYGIWSRARSDGTCVRRLSRWEMTGDTIDESTETPLLDNMYAQRLGHHTGADISFAKDGFLYLSTGDAECDIDTGGTTNCGPANDNSRDPHTLIGKLIRITRDGGIPPGNPYAATGGRCNTTGQTTVGRHCQEEFGMGLRNAFRLAADPNGTGSRVFVNDVGDATWEEVNLAQPGADYGWNVREGACPRGQRTNCGLTPAGFTNPVHSYVHDSSGCWSITGGAFVPAGIWPDPYGTAYLYGDYTCGRIFRIVPDGVGGWTRTTFATSLGGSSAIDLSFGPSGSTQALYYTTYANGGEVRRIRYTGVVNRTPTAQVTASPAFGGAPLPVTLDGSASSDPDAGDTLTYLWDFGDGSPTQQTSSATVAHTYTTAGTYFATLRVRDDHGATSEPASVRIDPGNTPPEPVIASPASGLRFAVGQHITLHGSATDAQDGTLPDSSLSWEVVLRHTNHEHPFLQSRPGNDIGFDAGAPESLGAAATSFYEIRLTATDAKGLSRTVTQDLLPNQVRLDFATEPAGLKVRVNNDLVTTPASFTSWEGFSFDVEAPAQTDGAGRSWTFASWSDGGAARHQVTTPATGATLTARYAESAAQALEAEAMTLPATAGFATVYSTASASGGRAVRFFRTASISAARTLPAVQRITVRAMGAQCEGAPVMAVTLDGTQVLSVPVAATSFTDYAADVNVPAGAHTIAVRFTNDHYVAGRCDRNLEVDRVTFGTTSDPAPAAPTGLAVTTGDGEVSLDWADNVEADLAGYDVYRGTVAGGPYTKVNGALVTTSSFRNTGLVNGTTYRYVVRAVDAAGHSSPPSSEVPATPSGTVNPLATVVEAEAMTLPATSGFATIYSSPAASGGRAVRLWRATALSATRTLPAIQRITVRAMGDQCDGAPVMAVTLDGSQVLSVPVPATTFTDYAADVSLPAGSHTIAVRFTNDAYVAGRCDRNLHVDKVTLTPVL